MVRAQCLVHRNAFILMVKHREPDASYWCLPGGVVEEGETAPEAALRELKEECNVTGSLIREVSAGLFPARQLDTRITFLIDIGEQEPVLGRDPEVPENNPVLIGVAWMKLRDLSEKDRAFLLASGVLMIPEIAHEIRNWTDDISYPGAFGSES